MQLGFVDSTNEAMEQFLKDMVGVLDETTNDIIQQVEKGVLLELDNILSREGSVVSSSM